MSKIKSVEERVASIIDSEAEYFPKTAISNGVIEDRQSFEEAIVEAVNKMPVIVFGHRGAYISKDDMMEAVRAIYQGNK